MIYLDNAASTRVDDAVIALMSEVMRSDYANPSAAHPAGAAARRRIATARDQVLAALGDPHGAIGDLIWASGGTEANALGVLGPARARSARAVMVSALEHPAVAASAAMLGVPVRIAPVTSAGVIDIDATAALIDDDVGVLAVMLVSNELGTVQPIGELVARVRAQAPGCHVHCDATPALAKVAIDVAALGVDSLGMSGHKLHGPKGTGGLWLRHGVELTPLWSGGGQQRGRRHGSQDTVGAAGFGLAVERAIAAQPAAVARWCEFATTIERAAERSGVPWRALAASDRAPHIVSIAFDRVSADGLREVMCSRGVIVSSGSACSTPGSKPSSALTAIGLPPTWGMVRMSFGLTTTADEIAVAAATLCEVVRDLAL
jgi:cysteine desulfurase